MATYNIYYEHPLSGNAEDDTIEGEGFLELSDDEVSQIVALLKKHEGKQDDALADMQSLMPSVYTRMDDAFRSIALDAEERFWLYRFFDDHQYDVSMTELLAYCQDNCGFAADSSDEQAVMDLFASWLDKFAHALPYDDFRIFAHQQLHLGVDLSNVQYDIEIPVEVVIMAQ